MVNKNWQSFELGNGNLRAHGFKGKKLEGPPPDMKAFAEVLTSGNYLYGRLS